MFACIHIDSKTKPDGVGHALRLHPSERVFQILNVYVSITTKSTTSARFL